MEPFENLFTAGHIGNLALKNRIVMPPMVTHLTRRGQVTDELVAYYEKRGSGGASLIVVEAAYFSRKLEVGRLSIQDDKSLPGLKRLAESVQQAGAKVALEINPGRGRSDEIDPLAPSDVPHPITGKRPRVLTAHGIEKLLEDFGNSVVIAKRAGFDAIMIHGAHGYLVSEFLSPRINTRKDKYGGDTKGRARLACELVEVTKHAAGRDFPVIFRLSASERVIGGLPLEESLQICKLLEKTGADAIDIVSGAADTFEWIVPGSSFPFGCNVELAEKIRQAIRIPVLVAGRINDPSIAEEVLRNKKADFVDMGRALIADPKLPLKAYNGDLESIRPCIACLRCIESFLRHEPLSCSVNPFVGKERKSVLTASAAQKKVLVIGGGPAGMQAALAARLKGHDVTLWEKEDRLGGQLLVASIPPYKGELKKIVSYLEGQLKKLNISIAFDKEASPESVLLFEPDAVVVATGSLPAGAEMPGVDLDIVVNNRELLAGKVRVGKKVVVVGGGLIGCETGEAIAEKAKEVTVLEKEERMAAESLEATTKPLIKRLGEKEIRMVTGANVVGITPEGVEIEDRKGGRNLLKADQVVLASGVVPESKLAADLRGMVSEIHVIGDCKVPRRILEAIHEGTAAAFKI